MSTDCEAVEAQLAAYSLGALEPKEAAQVERHLGQCEGCSTRFADYQRVRDGLLYMPSPVSPPARVRARLIAATSAQHHRANLWESLKRLPIAQTALMAAIGLVLILNLSLMAQSRQLERDLQVLRAQQASQQTALAITSYPTARVAQVSGDRVRGSVVYDPQFTMAVAYLWGLTPLPSNQIYQAWLVHPDGARTSAGLLEPDAESNFAVLVIEAPTPLSDFAGFGMTIEPAGGSPGPTGPKVAGADL